MAAPTAGLHFTPELLQQLRDAASASSAFVTLHVGAGTFLPVKADDTADHRCTPSGARSTPATARAAQRRARRRRAHRRVGTTSLRLLETAARATARSRAFVGETAIFITPGYRFRAADVLMTNFHLPKSTLFMLVCAFAGPGDDAAPPTPTPSRAATASIPTATPACCSAQPADQDDGPSVAR